MNLCRTPPVIKICKWGPWAQTSQENLTTKLRENLSVFILDPRLKPCLELGGKLFMDRTTGRHFSKSTVARTPNVHVCNSE